MKKFILILIAFLSFSAATFASDCGNCVPDIWSQDVMTKSYGPCLITIYYSHRKCMAGNDIRLDKILTSEECLLSLDVAIDFASRYLLNNSFEIFGAIGDSVELNFSADCCWKRTGTGVGDFPPYTYEPCEEQTCCCETELKIKKFIEFGVEKRRYIDSKNLLSDGTGTFCGTGCEKICDVFDDLTTGVGVAPVYAGDCDDSCGSVWNTSGSNTVTQQYGTSCEVVIYYQWRECSGIVEVKLSSMQYSGVGCGNIDDIMKEGLEEVLKDVATKTLLNTIQIRIGTCWQDINFQSQDFVKSCYEDDCCVAEYELTTTSGGHKIVTNSTDISSTYSVCREINGCTFICNDTHLGVPENELLVKRAANSINGNLFETTSEVIPNPATESITLNVNSKIDGDLLITISDLNGKTVYKQTINKTNESIQVLVNVKEFAKGTYFYGIRAGLYNINGGKFIKE